MPERAKKPTPPAGVMVGRCSNDSLPPGGGITQEHGRNTPRDCDWGGSNSAPNTKQKTRKLGALVLEQESIEDEYRQKLGMRGAYLGTESRGMVSQKITNAAERSLGFRQAKIEATKAFFYLKPKNSADGGSDDGGDTPGDKTPDVGAGEQT